MVAISALAAATASFGSAAETPKVERSTEPVILSGQLFAEWSAGPEVTVREPQIANDPAGIQSQCSGTKEYPDGKDHSCYQDPRLRIAGVKDGVAVQRLLGYRWSGSSFEQIPFQIDERFTRYLTNNNSGFAFYSGADKHTTYAFDREGWRFTDQDPSNPCLAAPRDGIATAPDPIAGLDDNDELVFMFDDAGEAAPAAAALPAGIAGSKKIQVTDPTSGASRFIYVMLATESGPTAAFNETNGHVRYQRDADADQYLYSESSYDDYGATLSGAYFDPATGTCVTSTPKQRRPRDTAWIKTDKYAFRYDGRWLMTELRVSPGPQDGCTTTSACAYGPDLIDQWKARAFQQRPGGQTPCCGYEEEVNNWGGSSILLGELSGPVRAVRETWGADSATNNIRREVFYRDEIRQQNYLRVHPIPPADGIYVQWDYNAGKVTRYSNPYRPEGVPIDGKNDEVFGNLYGHVGGDGIDVRDNDPVPVVGPIQVSEDEAAESDTACPKIAGAIDCVYNDFDVHDPTLQGPNGALSWEQISGPNGSLVTRWQKLDVNAGNGYTVTTFPYYRDDSCFDDGTGSDPGPHLNSRKPDSGEFGLYEGLPRRCWDSATDPVPTGGPTDRQYLQGDIGTHGLHVNFIADSDNAMMTESLTEITSEYRMVVLSGDPGNVGDLYGRAPEYPLVIRVL